MAKYRVITGKSLYNVTSINHLDKKRETNDDYTKVRAVVKWIRKKWIPISNTQFESECKKPKTS